MSIWKEIAIFPFNYLSDSLSARYLPGGVPLSPASTEPISHHHHHYQLGNDSN